MVHHQINIDPRNQKRMEIQNVMNVVQDPRHHHLQVVHHTIHGLNHGIESVTKNHHQEVVQIHVVVEVGKEDPEVETDLKVGDVIIVIMTIDVHGHKTLTLFYNPLTLIKVKSSFL